MRIAITRQVSPAINQCELTYLAREPIDYEHACAQHKQYEDALRSLGMDVISLPAEPDLPDSVFVEDVALVLGSAFDQALGDRKGITRMASFYAPMDETLAFIALDLSGRPYAVIDAEWGHSPVGQIPTSLFLHFLESFAINAKCNVHARVLYGRDDHHKAEALFKALARALDEATKFDSRRGGVPSTKGSLTE